MGDARCLTREQAASYCNLSPEGFSAWQRKGIVPGPMPGTARWDRKALDAALDARSGLSTVSEPEDAYLAWERTQNEASASGRR